MLAKPVGVVAAAWPTAAVAAVEDVEAAAREKAGNRATFELCWSTDCRRLASALAAPLLRCRVGRGGRNTPDAGASPSGRLNRDARRGRRVGNEGGRGGAVLDKGELF